MPNTRTEPGFALLVRTDGRFRLLDWPENDNQHLKILYAACDCTHIDAVTVTEALTLWVDDEGMLNGAEFNAPATRLYALHRPPHQPYFGQALFTGGTDPQGNTLGLTADEAAHLLQMLLTLGGGHIPTQRTSD
ncbi:DUF3846 domain-containing protein [Streptomyces sp. NPDC050145]|uniref:DUF3846 domain-containing protein n=1 Tax=Streptomyces sp. NPDC050145 TaxID=3365602 RepID=UPI00379D69FB